MTTTTPRSPLSALPLRLERGEGRGEVSKDGLMPLLRATPVTDTVDRRPQTPP